MANRAVLEAPQPVVPTTLAEAWERGHRYCECQREGGVLQTHENPYPKEEAHG